jgi:Leucine-rich repeat (LRR) protein
MKKTLLFLLISLIFITSESHSQNKILTLNELQKTKMYNSLEDAVKEPDKVYRINLSNKGMTEFPVELTAFSNLQSLNLSYNKITEIPKEIGNLFKLQYLNLEGTEITILPPETSQLKNLVSLDLDMISTLNSSIALNVIFDILNLKELSMNSVFIMSVPSQIKKLKNLSRLNMSNCGITDITNEIGSLKNLTYLELSFNELTSLPAEIGEMEKLREMYLGGNQLKDLPVEIKNLDETLQILSLSQAKSSSEEYSGNPISKETVDKIQQWLPDTKIIFIWN